MIKAAIKLARYLLDTLETKVTPKDVDDGAPFTVVKTQEAQELIADYERFREEKPTKPDLPKPLKGSLAERLAKESNQ